MCHCEGRGLEAIVGHKSHILLNEQGGIAQVFTITKICTCKIQRFFSSVKVDNVIEKISIFFIFLFKTLIVGSC